MPSLGPPEAPISGTESPTIMAFHVLCCNGFFKVSPRKQRQLMFWFPCRVLPLALEGHDPCLISHIPSVVGMFPGRLTEKGRPALTVRGGIHGLGSWTG